MTAPRSDLRPRPWAFDVLEAALRAYQRSTLEAALRAGVPRAEATRIARAGVAEARCCALRVCAGRAGVWA